MKRGLVLPDFIIVGAMKAGTTSLAKSLNCHPLIKISSKEPHFFDRDKNYQRGRRWYSKKLKDFNWYKKLAQRKKSPNLAEGRMLVGEKTPTYSYQENCAERIGETVHKAKLIWIFRNPTQRAYSNYLHAKRSGSENLDLATAIAREPERIKENIFYGYVERGKYADQVERYLKRFSAEQMIFILFEDLLKNRLGELNRVVSFLGASPLSEDLPDFHSNKSNVSLWNNSAYFAKKLSQKGLGAGKLLYWIVRGLNHFISGEKPEMSQEIREQLTEYYIPYNERLERLTGLDLSPWKQNK